MAFQSKIVVVGGGFFGMYLAEYLAKKKHSVILLERETSLMKRASYHNQARVHTGYHYPRSVLTALRSRVSFPQFVEEFADAIVSNFDQYYLIGRPLGKISANQFRIFCDRIGAVCNVAPNSVQSLVNPHYIEACFSAIEYAFDSERLCQLMMSRLLGSGVEIRLKTQATKVSKAKDQLVLTTYNEDQSEDILVADQIFNCTYSNLNFLLRGSGIEPIPLKHEMTEMCVVEVPEEIRSLGLTVMCGPFFSVMPFPSLNLHSFSHVRYTPHYEWFDQATNKIIDAEYRPSAWELMRRDAARYIPLLKDCKFKKSLWEVKTVLPRSENDDSRPILFRPNHGLLGMHSIVGGKIDNVYDVIKEIEASNLCG